MREVLLHVKLLISLEYIKKLCNLKTNHLVDENGLFTMSYRHGL